MRVVSSRRVAICNFWSNYRQHRRPGRGPWPSALVVVLQCRSGLLLKPDKNVSRVVGWVRGRIGRGVHIWGVLPIRHPPRSLNFSSCWALPCNAGPLQSCPTSWWSIQQCWIPTHQVSGRPSEKYSIARRIYQETTKHFLAQIQATHGMVYLYFCLCCTSSFYSCKAL